MSNESDNVKFDQGLTSLEREIEIDHLPVSGKLPLWLSGTLVRNGPAKFEVGTQKYRHWFDGLAMLHGFHLQRGRVFLTSTGFCKANDYKISTAKGKIAYSTFATDHAAPFLSGFSRSSRLRSVITPTSMSLTSPTVFWRLLRRLFLSSLTRTRSKRSACLTITTGCKAQLPARTRTLISLVNP